MAEIYLNNAATSFPKPPEVIEAVRQALENVPIDPGRGLSKGQTSLDDCRKALATLIGQPDHRRVILTPGATYALNTAIQGIAKPFAGGHIVTTALEHNSVLRPIRTLIEKGSWEADFLSPRQAVNPLEYLQAVRGDTRMIVMTAASNVTGQQTPFEDVSKICSERGIALIVDAAQAAGSVLIDVQNMPDNSFVAFAGHKGLQGPQGTGALWAGRGINADNCPAILQGGTGIRSDYPLQPPECPIHYEAGTPNMAGFAGLTAGVDWVRKSGVDNAGKHKHNLISELVDLISGVAGVTLYLPVGNDYRAGALSFNIEGWDPDDIGFTLQESFGIIVRSGLHCAPLIHQSLGCPEGSVRVSVGPYNTSEEIKATADAVRSLARMSCRSAS